MYAVLHFWTSEPDSPDLPLCEYDCENIVYNKAHEEIPTDIPKPLRQRVVLSDHVNEINQGS